MKHYLSYNQRSGSGVSFHYYIRNFLKKIELFILVVFCLGLIILSKTHKEFNSNISLFIVKTSAPVVNLVRFPFVSAGQVVNYLHELANVRNENILLKNENEKLKSVFIKALNISQENDELKELLKFTSTRSITFNSVRLIITKPNQLYGNNVIINAGSDQGIVENSVITGSKSVIGRAIDIGKDISRILSITDENSRIPIVTSNSKDRGILTGHNTKTMTIEYLGDHHINVGDLVFTSGDGEYLPPGLLIGVVTKVNGNHVEVEAAENINNVSYATVFKY